MSPLRHSLGDETGVALAEAHRGRTLNSTALVVDMSAVTIKSPSKAKAML